MGADVGILFFSWAGRGGRRFGGRQCRSIRQRRKRRRCTGIGRHCMPARPPAGLLAHPLRRIENSNHHQEHTSKCRPNPSCHFQNPLKTRPFYHPSLEQSPWNNPRSSGAAGETCQHTIEAVLKWAPRQRLQSLFQTVLNNQNASFYGWGSLSTARWSYILAKSRTSWVIWGSPLRLGEGANRLSPTDRGS